MFCGHCGSELKEGARFCSACGAPVGADGVPPEEKSGDTAGAAPENAVEAASKSAADEGKSSQSAFANQMEADRKRSRRKLSPLMIIAFVLALLTGTALAAVLITQQANRGEEPVEQEQPTATQSPESSAAAEPVFDQAKAEEEARAAAEAAGKTVLTGTVFIGVEEEWASLEGLSRAPNPGYNIAYVGLVLDEPAAVSAQHFDGRVVERSGSYVLLGSSSEAGVLASWDPYDGQRVTVALSDIWAFSDTLGVLFAFRGTGERIAPLTEADVAGATGAGGAAESGSVAADGSTESTAADADGSAGNAAAAGGAAAAGAAATGAVSGDRPLNGSRFISLDSASSSAEAATAASGANGDYILAESSTKRYVRAELEGMDARTLFLARNEIFARHGCGFKSQELRDWFASKSWYTETIPAGTYGADLLTNVEADNVKLIRTVEESLNSPYLS